MTYPPMFTACSQELLDTSIESVLAKSAFSGQKQGDVSRDNSYYSGSDSLCFCRFFCGFTLSYASAILLVDRIK